MRVLERELRGAGDAQDEVDAALPTRSSSSTLRSASMEMQSVRALAADMAQVYAIAQVPEKERAPAQDMNVGEFRCTEHY